MTITHSPAQQLLTEYVISGKLMQVATIGPDGCPAVCNVWYAAAFTPDRLSFISRHDRDHSANIRRDPHIAGGIIAIDLEGLGQKVRGVTFKGTATELPQKGIDEQLARFHQRWPAAQAAINPDNLATGQTPSRLYEISVTEWVLFDEVNFPDDPRQVLTAK